ETVRAPATRTPAKPSVSQQGGTSVVTHTPKMRRLTDESGSLEGAAQRRRFACRMSNVSASAVREILKVTERPDIISFAGGMPAPELFPVSEIARAHAQVFAEEGAAALQYSTTEGWRPLREWVAARYRERGVVADADRVLITTGSQQG